jgi:G3E family GTPase
MYFNHGHRYGINSFVYRSRRPFHPARLYELVHDKFVILEPQNEEEEEEEEEEDENFEYELISSSSSATAEGENFESLQQQDSPISTPPATLNSPTITAATTTTSPSTSFTEDTNKLSQYPDIPLEQRLMNKKAHPLFSRLLRSKGFIWLATRPKLSGDWSQAGAMLAFSPGLQWFTTLPENEWPLPVGDAGKEVKNIIKKDFEGEWGDRRQEVVLIGEGLDVDGLTACLDSCLLTVEEMQEWEGVMRMDCDEEKREDMLNDLFEDGWEEWDDPQSMMNGDEEGHVHGPACAI